MQLWGAHPRADEVVMGDDLAWPDAGGWSRALYPAATPSYVIQYTETNRTSATENSTVFSVLTNDAAPNGGNLCSLSSGGLFNF